MYLDSPIYKGYLETHKETKQLLLPRLLDNLKKSDPSFNDEEWACDSFQTFLYGNGQEDLANQIEPHINNYLGNLGYPNGLSYDTNSWFNMYGANQYQEEHSHIPMFFSGVYVLNFDPAMHTGLTFISRSPAIFALHRCKDVYPTGFPEATDNIELKLKEGDIYIWPADRRHRVAPQPKNLKNNYRVTYTFNVIM